MAEQQPILSLSLPPDIAELEQGYRDYPKKLQAAINRVINKALTRLKRRAKEQIPATALIAPERAEKRVLKLSARGDKGDGSVTILDGGLALDGADLAQDQTGTRMEVLRGVPHAYPHAFIVRKAGWVLVMRRLGKGKKPLEVLRGEPLREGMELHNRYGELEALAQEAAEEAMPAELDKMAQAMAEKH